MIGLHPTRDLARYCDGQLPAPRAAVVERHLAGCARCRQEVDEIRFAASMLRQVELIPAPDSLWASVARELDGPARTPGVRFVPHWQLQLAAVALIAIVAAVIWSVRPGQARPWQVADSATGRSTSRAVGDWVETASSRARITVGAIGTVEVEPNTRVRLGTLQPHEYRLALAHGTIRAAISAPPRLFIVDTPASTVVDLGCAYRATVDARGNGTVQVTEGWISLDRNGLESLVPAGAAADIRSEVGPGSPVFEDAAPGFKRLVQSLDFEGGGNQALTSLLSQARARDTLTLWHLLRRVDPGARQRVYDRIVALVPASAGIPREAVLALDADALRRFREELAWKW